MGPTNPPSQVQWRHRPIRDSLQWKYRAKLYDCPLGLHHPEVDYARDRTVDGSLPSEDHKKVLTGYVFLPAADDTGEADAAIVLLHGSAGRVIASLDKGVYRKDTPPTNHKQWGELWAERGYVALLVDSFGPRGYPGGFLARQLRGSARRGEWTDGSPARCLPRLSICASMDVSRAGSACKGGRTAA